MRFGLSAEQEALQEAVMRFTREKAGLAQARAFAQAAEPGAEDVVAGLQDLGVPGILISAEAGGLGLGLFEAALVAEAFGAAATPAAFIGAHLLAPLALAAGGGQGERLKAIAQGRLAMGVALSEHTGARAGAGLVAQGATLNGRTVFVIDIEADAFIVADKAGGLHIVEANAPGLSIVRMPTIDATRRTGELVFDAAPAERLSDDPAIIRRLIDAGRIAYAADMLGAAQCMLDQAVAYAKQREQFGRPIATFQAVKHMCAEMAAALEPARALVWYGAHAFDTKAADASIAACHAKAHLSEVATMIAKTATEVHGGMGFTDLVGLHFWFKRIGFNRQMLGGPEAVRADAARLQGL
jgi:alkylation response protein AidB-like acyl-CoA dehydrogenase